MLRVEGPVAAAPALERELRRASHGSTGVVVDLTGVTLLASAGVAGLTRARRYITAEAGLRLISPPGSSAAHILSLVRIPHGPDEDLATVTAD